MLTPVPYLAEDQQSIFPNCVIVQSEDNYPAICHDAADNYQVIQVWT